MKTIKQSSAFKKDLKRYRNRLDKLSKIQAAISILAYGQEIPSQMRPHRLIGNYEGYMELHIEGDLLLIWIEISEETGQVVIILERLGSHAELFGK